MPVFLLPRKRRMIILPIRSLTPLHAKLFTLAAGFKLFNSPKLICQNTKGESTLIPLEHLYFFCEPSNYHFIILTILRYPIAPFQGAMYTINFNGINKRNHHLFFTLSYQLTDYHGPYCRLIFIRLSRSGKCNCLPLMCKACSGCNCSASIPVGTQYRINGRN